MAVSRAKGGYTVQAAVSTAFSPADATTYHIGSMPSATPSTSGGNARIYLPKAGTIKSISIFFLNATSSGSNESSTMNLRLNNATDTLISSSIAHDVAAAVISNASLAIAVNAGDYFELKWTTPT